MRRQGVWQIYARSLAAALGAGFATSPALAGANPAPVTQSAQASTPLDDDASPAGAKPAPRVERGGHGPTRTARLFVWGPSPGAPSTAKRTLVYGFYGLSGLATASTAVFVVRWLSDRVQVDQHLERHRGSCHDLGSARCSELVSLRATAYHSASWAATSAAVAASGLLGAVLTAQLWDNVEIATSAWRSGGRTHVKIRF